MAGHARQLACFAAACAALLPAFAAAGAPPPLNCPAGTVSEKKDRRPELPLIEEYCVDFRTRQRHGPTRTLELDGSLAGEGRYESGHIEGAYRLFLANGQVSKIIEYSKGRKVSERLTVAGLRDMVRKGNESLKGGTTKSTLEMVNDHTVMQTTVVPALPPGVKDDAEVLRKMVLGNPAICKSFVIPSPMTLYVARYVYGDGREIARIDVTLAHCAGQLRAVGQAP